MTAPGPDGTRRIPLRHPIQRRSAKTGEVVDTVAELVMRPLKLGDMVAAMDAAGGTKDLGTMTLHLAARACGVPAGELAELDIEDGATVLEAVSDFMPAGLRTGTGG